MRTLSLSYPLLAVSLLVQCQGSPRGSAVAEHSDEVRLTWLPGTKTGTTQISVREGDKTLLAHAVDFDVTCGLLAAEGRIALGGMRTRESARECVLAIGAIGSESFVEKAWPITEGDDERIAAPIIEGMFVNDTARILFVRANATSPFEWDSTSGENWWRISLDTAEYCGTTQPQSTWRTQGQLSQNGSLVSCSQIPETPLLLAHWATYRGSPGSKENVEVGERIQVLDPIGVLLFELPIRSHLETISVPSERGFYEFVKSVAERSPSRPRVEGPGRVSIFAEDPARSATLSCARSDETSAGWRFTLTPAKY